MSQEVGFGDATFGLRGGKLEVVRRRRSKRARMLAVWAVGSGS